jgi:hypothetical protein
MKCPYCDDALGIPADPSHVHPGDGSECPSCGRIIIVGDEMDFRPPTPEEEERISNSREMQIAREILRFIRNRHNN